MQAGIAEPHNGKTGSVCAALKTVRMNQGGGNEASEEDASMGPESGSIRGLQPRHGVMLILSALAAFQSGNHRHGQRLECDGLAVGRTAPVSGSDGGLR